ncbi:hypothetical protein BH18ACT15_BH18ACT15_01770 [soil metagenome]
MHPALKQSAVHARIGELQRAGRASARPAGRAHRGRHLLSLRQSFGLTVVGAGLRLALHGAGDNRTDAWGGGEGRPGRIA